MNSDQLRQLISQGEYDRLEFKKSTSQLKAVFETICAFLNNKGGTILIGVKNNGQIVGQDLTDNTKKEIAKEIKKIEPKPHIDVYYLPVANNKQVIVIEVPTGKHIPYAYDGRPFERNQSTTERMTQHSYEQLIVHRGQLNHSWEGQIATGYEIDDLDHNEIMKTIKEGVDKNRIAVEVFTHDIEYILQNLSLIKNGQLTNAAVVLFAKKITDHYSHCAIKLARFKGRDKLGDFIDSQWITGNAFQIIQAAHDFTSRHLPIAGFFEPDKWQRIDQPAVPALALREALINAISHRDYTVYNSTITLAIYDDRLELWNVGELPIQLKLEDIKTPHGSYPRNKNIATVFYKRGWIESWGTGITRMIGFCEKNKTPEPEFTQYSGGFSITFPFKVPMHSVTEQESYDRKTSLTQRQAEIVSILEQTPEIPATQIHDKLQVKIPIRTLQYELNKLKKLGFVLSKGHARSFTWSLKKK